VSPGGGSGKTSRNASRPANAASLIRCPWSSLLLYCHE
jgi:hypothetical protein